MAQSVVSPEILRFTQDSIKNTFKKPYEYQRIDDAVDQIGNNQLSPAVFMPLNVVQHKSVMWSLDNRRLWVLRKAGVPTVKVMLVLPNHNRRSGEFFSTLNDQLVRRYSSANYFPRVRGGVRSHVGIAKGTSGGALRPPIQTPMAVAGAHNNNTTPTRVPHHLRTGTVRIDISAKVNREKNSMGFDKQSQAMPHYNAYPNNLRFTQHANVSSSHGGAPPRPIPLLHHHSASTILPKVVPPFPSLSPSPSLSPHLLKDFTQKINTPPPTNGGAPPLHHYPTSTLANPTFSKYKPSPSPPPPSLSPSPPAYHLRDSTVRMNIHPSIPPLRKYTSYQLSEGTVPLLSNNGSVPLPRPIPLLHHHSASTILPKFVPPFPFPSLSPSPFLSPHLLKDFTQKINTPPPTNGGAPPLHHCPTSTLANPTFSKYKPSPSPPPPSLSPSPPAYHLRDSTVRMNIHPSIPPLRKYTSYQLSEETVPLLSNPRRKVYGPR